MMVTISLARVLMGLRYSSLMFRQLNHMNCDTMEGSAGVASADEPGASAERLPRRPTSAGCFSRTAATWLRV